MTGIVDHLSAWNWRLYQRRSRRHPVQGLIGCSWQLAMIVDNRHQLVSQLCSPPFRCPGPAGTVFHRLPRPRTSDRTSASSKLCEPACGQVAVIALGAPRWAFFLEGTLRAHCPSDEAHWPRLGSTSDREPLDPVCRRNGRSAAAALFAFRVVLELITLPPLTLLLGLNPNQEAKCFTVGHRLMSVPVSLTTFSAVYASTPSIAVRSTPARYVRTSNLGALPWRGFAPACQSPTITAVIELTELISLSHSSILRWYVLYSSRACVSSKMCSSLQWPRSDSAISLSVSLHRGMSELCQRSRVALTFHDRLDYLHPGPAGDVAQDVLQLDVHLRQRLPCAGCDETHTHGALAQVTSAA